MLIIYYSLPTGFGNNCDHNQGTFARILVKYRGIAVAQWLRYKSEGRWFDSRWCHWNFSLTQSFPLHHGPGIDSASNINEYQEHFLGVKAAGA
jgi:hypothetical protein